MNIFKRAWIKVDDFLEGVFSDIMLNVFGVDVRTAEEVRDELVAKIDSETLGKVKKKIKERHQGPILEDVKQESLTYIDDKGIERLNSDNTFYGVSSEKSKVYHILGDFDLASMASSLCNMAGIGLDKALDTIPTDKKLCRLCEVEDDYRKVTKQEAEDRAKE